MSKKGATSSHFDPAKAGAEVHNRREKDLYYVRKDLSPLNQTWEARGFVSVADARTKVEAKYYAHHITGKGTHKHLPSNSTPIQETVLVINNGTTMEQLQDFARMVQETWGYTPLGIYMHLDEGHAKAMDKGKWIPNLHAHLIFDSTDEHGDSLKPLSQSQKAKIQSTWEKKEKDAAKKEGREPRKFIEPENFKRPDFDLLQDFAAKALGMERGEKSARRHLDVIEYKLEKMSEELEEVKAAKEQAETGKVKAEEATEQAIAEKDKAIEERDVAIAERDEAREENTSLRADNTILREQKADLQDDMKDIQQEIKQLSSQVGTGAKIKGFFGVGPEASIRQELKALKDSIATKVAKAKEEGIAEGKAVAETTVIKAIMTIANPDDTKDHTANDVGVMLRDARLDAVKADNNAKSYSMWRNIALAMWRTATDAVAVIGKYLHYKHLNISFSASEVATVDKALGTKAELRQGYGRALVNMAHADYPGYKDDDARLSALNREVDKIADYSHPQMRESQTRGLTR